ncbi:MAG: pyridoxal-phosphate dependent enzyme [Desulfosarcinaceae bacterium]|nr:pyridoxal-phosphate dependent enzyme [Desulfosarcinaceae bacterium]
MHRYGNILDMVGQTPLLEIRQLDTGPCRLFLKLELMNPGGSIKDRIGVAMIAAAEARGDIRPGDTLVEATAGNTGIGLALAAAQKGYRLLLVIPDKMSAEKIFTLRAMGAEVILTRSDVEKGHPEYYQDLGKRLAQERGAYFINQFGNPDNPRAHADTTAPEIWAQMDHRLDAIVVGVGSSGTITGLTQFFRKVAPDLTLVLADPQGSVLADVVTHGRLGRPTAAWLVEGIGEDFVPEICDLSFTTRAYSISDAESFHAARDLLRKEGLLVGSSSGTCLAAALRYCRAQQTPKRVVTFACDTGNKYLSKLFNDFWMAEHGFLETPTSGDLQDLIGRPHGQRATVTVSPREPLATAHNRMRDGGFSQLPVVDEGRLVGMLTEKDLLAVLDDAADGWSLTVGQTMRSNFATIAPEAPLAQLQTLLADQPWVAVVSGSRFLGLITRMDLLNHLRRRRTP